MTDLSVLGMKIVLMGAIIGTLVWLVMTVSGCANFMDGKAQSAAKRQAMAEEYCGSQGVKSFDYYGVKCGSDE